MSNQAIYLKGYIPKPLSQDGSTVISVRIPKELLPHIDAKRGTKTRSEYIRDLLNKQ